jgi:DNA-binding LacI/PurR family transcriptional regulator
MSPEELTGRAEGLPLVVLGERDPHGVADHVAIDDVTAAREVTDHLLSLGRRRIGIIGAQPHLRSGTAELRLRGVRRSLGDAGLPADPSREVPVASLHRSEGLRAMELLLATRRPPDAVLCFTDELALGAMHAIRRGGLRIPHDIAVAGFDDIEDGRFAGPPLTTISPGKHQIATTAVQCLADRIYGRLRDLPGRQVTAGHELLLRQSTLG